MKIETFEDACNVLGVEEEKVKFLFLKKVLNKLLFCNFKLTQFTPHQKVIIISQALNKELQPEWETPKFYEMSEGFGVFLTKELAEEAAKKFKKEYEQAFT